MYKKRLNVGIKYKPFSKVKGQIRILGTLHFIRNKERELEIKRSQSTRIITKALYNV